MRPHGTRSSRKLITHEHWERATKVLPSRKYTEGRRTIYHALKHRVQVGLQAHGARLIYKQGLYVVRWRMEPWGRVYTGRVRLGRWRFAQELVGTGMSARYRPRPFWLFDLQGMGWKGRHEQFTRPDFWFLGFSEGGTIVLPDHVLPGPWVRLTLKERSPGYWPWRFWERWDGIQTFPDVPEDVAQLALSKPSVQKAPVSERRRSTYTKPAPLGRPAADSPRFADAGSSSPDGLPTG